MPSTSLQVDRYLIAAAVVLSCVLFTSQAADPVNVIKLTALLLIAIAVTCTSLYRAVRHRVVQLPLGVAGAAGVLLMAAFALSAATAAVATTAVVGTYGRNSGLLAYGAALSLFFAGLRVLHRPHARIVVGGVVLAGLFTASYGLLQRLGIDAIAWNNPFNPIIAALGNPNFASAYLGIAAAVGAGGALFRGWVRGWRALSGATGALCLLAAVLSSSVQGPVAAAAGLFVVATAVALDLSSGRRRIALAGLAALGVAGSTALVAGAVAKAGPAAAAFSDVGSRARGYYWSAALEMFSDAPVLGVGLDHYGKFWRTARSVESSLEFGGSDYSDAAHSVPLQMLAQGGLVLGLAYALLVCFTLYSLLRGLMRLEGDDRRLLAAVGAGWAAYQVQSAVSIDQVPLLVLHFVLAGAVIATAGHARLREVRLPGAAAPVATHRNDARAKRRVETRPRDRDLNGLDLVFVSVVGVAAATAGWLALVPLRADAAAQEAASARARGDGTTSALRYDRATDLLPGRAEYWISKGNLFQAADPPRPAQALTAYRHALRRDPYAINAARAAAELAEQIGDLDTARRLFRDTAALDPLNPDSVLAAATFELRHNGAEWARGVLEQAVQKLPSSAALWASLGDARAVLGDPAAARSAYETALELEPGSETATDGLRKLMSS